ncbi:hypothetical protein [Pseudodesulfovibrio portus]|uniref:Lipoprotein n=1 Tax=Pseudodesulfovibrio portus TaxID=231439 RepID=A0ABN6RWW0_9BACT|nr:hypothetical protein [Pseudodesulfovibrio portus]BDQ34321.1 hypothetical protein JCM14722_18630 [Pseudodesulfovibrio portus]
MRTILKALLLSLTLALALGGCGFFDDSPEEPMEPAVAQETGDEAAAPQADASEEGASGTEAGLSSTNEVEDIVPEGPVATLQLANGSTIEVLGLAKLGKYYLYISGELNGRTSTVISYTRFQDVAKWDAFIFKDPNNFIITTKEGKELVFMNARLFLGSDSNDTYSFYAFNDNYEKALIVVKKSDVATIKFN